jgi:mRNA capping enzyme, catalytic domain/mRNA capping enzyme, beta chain
MSKRPGGFSLSGTANKVRKLNETTRRTNANNFNAMTKNGFLSERVMDITTAIGDFLTDARRQAVSSEGTQQFEVEARFGVLHVGPSRVTSSGAKTDPNGTIIPAFICPLTPTVSMDSGVSRRHFKQRTGAGLGADSAIALAFGVPRGANSKAILEETRYIETNFAYANNKRLVLDGEFDAHLNPGSELNPPGRYEYKTRIVYKDLIIPAANYDMRISLASEKTTERVARLPPDASLHRVKRRVSYKRRDGQNPWQIDVTAVTSTDLRKKTKSTTVYEIEMELQAIYMDQLMKETSPEKVNSMIRYISEKLWEIMQHLNPLEETIDVEEKLEPHPNQKAVSLALETCSALKKFMDDGQPNNFSWPIMNPNGARYPPLRGLPGCMPVNFDREDMEKVQVAPDNDYFLSEKTDGVRHFMIFTGDSVVLVDRALNAKRPKVVKSSGLDPMADLVKLVQPGTVLDGEVVMHRGTPHTANGMQSHEARPIFDAFDVMMVGGTPILHHKFEARLKALQQASFCHNPQSDASRVFPRSVADMSIPLPMVRKRFVNRRQIGELFNCVIEEKGFRSYRQLPLYNHLTDGVIFQPNTPYKCGTDHDLSKWKYPDTATIDVKLLEEHVYRSDFGGRKAMNDDDEDGLEIFPVVACQDSVVVDMKRHIHLPRSELYRMNADRFEIRKNIAEVGKDPASGEWYYLTMRPDKTDANHISTVLGTTLELAEALDWKELQYTMQLRSDESNNWSRERSKMDDVLMETQRLKHQKLDSKKK